MISLRVVLSFQSRVSGTVSFSVLDGGEPFTQRLQLAFDILARVFGCSPVGV